MEQLRNFINYSCMMFLRRKPFLYPKSQLDEDHPLYRAKR